MKKLISVCLILTMLFSLFTAIPTGAADKLFVATLEYDGAKHDYRGTYFDIVVNGEKIDTPIPPIVLANGRSIVPVREIFEAMGATVSWKEGKPSRIEISNEDTTVSLAIGNNVAKVNGKEVKMEVAAKLVGYEGIGKTMVPVRFVAETLDMQVDYSEEKALISIAAQPSIKLVHSVVRQVDDETVTSVFSFSQAVEGYSKMFLENPNRVVVDVRGSISAEGQYTHAAIGNVTQIRLGEHDTYMRIVFDVTVLPKLRISLTDDKKTLTIVQSTAADFSENEPAADGPIVVIDAGHGGSDPGAIGYDESGKAVLQEKDVNLNIAKKVYSILKEKGVNVYMTRDTDTYVSLSDRTEFANKLDAALFISIHCNSFTSSDMDGTLVMHHTDESIANTYGVHGRMLSNNILKYLPAAMGTENKGRVDGNAMYVIRKAKMPSVIVETAFISNAEDREKLADETYRILAAEAIAQGILDTLPKLKANVRNTNSSKTE